MRRYAHAVSIAALLAVIRRIARCRAILLWSQGVPVPADSADSGRRLALPVAEAIRRAFLYIA